MFTHSVEPITVESHSSLLFFDLLLYVISILTLHNQNIDFANVKISNRCAYDLRLSCTFVVDTLLNLSNGCYKNEDPRKRRPKT